ncbi:MAG TPA: DUF2279 domain-containing protein [Gemmatimonadaceae bacterium]|nr:DUF2279 domain-containing protein [Gemmatimonadaceae bacterium]
MKRAAAVAAVLFVAAVTSVEAVRAQVPRDSARSTPDSAARDTAPSRTGIALRSDSIQVIDPDAAAAHCGIAAGELRLRRAGVAAAFVAGNAALFSYFKRAWWSGERAETFFFQSDWDQSFRDQDKFGHAIGGYHLARFGAAFLRSGCMSKTRAVMWSAAYAAAFQLQIEIWDGLYKKYGFSYPDLLANTTGTALAVLHETVPATRAIRPTISYARSAAMRNADNIPGELRPSLDYSGQTYWLSADIDALLPRQAKPYWPAFLRLSAGHSITDWVDPATGASMRARRKLLLSIDFDAEKLPGENRLWKTFKRQLGYIHLPSPALEITPDLKVIGWYK